jgi:hypothetical protein
VAVGESETMRVGRSGIVTTPPPCRIVVGNPGAAEEVSPPASGARLRAHDADDSTATTRSGTNGFR